MTTTSYPGGYTTLLEALSHYNGASGYFVSISAGANVLISDSEFSNGFASNGGLVYMSGNSALTLTSSNFTRGYADI